MVHKICEGTMDPTVSDRDSEDAVDAFDTLDIEPLDEDAVVRKIISEMIQDRTFSHHIPDTCMHTYTPGTRLSTLTDTFSEVFVRV